MGLTLEVLGLSIEVRKLNPQNGCFCLFVCVVIEKPVQI